MKIAFSRTHTRAKLDLGKNFAKDQFCAEEDSVELSWIKSLVSRTKQSSNGILSKKLLPRDDVTLVAEPLLIAHAKTQDKSWDRVLPNNAMLWLASVILLF